MYAVMADSKLAIEMLLNFSAKREEVCVCVCVRVRASVRAL